MPGNITRKQDLRRRWRSALGAVSVAASVSALAMSAAGCGKDDLSHPKSVLPDTSVSDPVNPPVDPVTPPATPPAPSHATDVLLFNGTGVSTSDWQNTERIIKARGWSYKLVNSAQMDALSLDEIASFGLIVVPGGYGGTIYRNLTPATRLRIRAAVQDRGVGYVGFCAGAWVAVGEEAYTSETASYGFAVAKGPHLKAFYPGGDSSLVADIVEVTFADGSKRSLVWWGGPWTPEWQDGVIARYDNGRPAISQTWSGNGLVVIAGPHPEAPQGWRATAGTDPDGLDYDIAIGMMEAALYRKPMPSEGGRSL